MTNSSPRQAALVLASFAVALFAAFGTAWAGPQTRLKVTAPTGGVVPAGLIPVKAKLSAPHSAKVVRARFYVNGKLVTTDKRYPFAIRRGVKFDTRSLPTLDPTLKIVVRYDVRRKHHRTRHRKLTKKIRLKLFAAENPGVGSKGEEAPAPTGPAGPYWPDGPTGAGTSVSFSDDFNAPALDTSKWNNQRFDHLNGNDPGPTGNGTPYNGFEGARYGGSTENVGISGAAANRYLRLTKTDSPAPGVSPSTGMVNADGKFSFKYGYAEARIAAPSCYAPHLGCWPAFWILPTTNTWPPEIDIFELIQVEPSIVEFPVAPYSTPHWAASGPSDTTGPADHNPIDDSNPGDGQAYKNLKPGDTTKDYTEDSTDFPKSSPGFRVWHTYGMWWTPDFLKFYVDGKLGATFDYAPAIPHVSMYPIFVLSIPAGYDPDSGKSMKIDYVRIWTPDKK